MLKYPALPILKNTKREIQNFQRKSVTWVLKREMNSWGDYSSEAREGYYIRPIFVIRIVSSYLGLTCTQFKRLAQTSCFVSKNPLAQNGRCLDEHVKDTYGWNSNTYGKHKVWYSIKLCKIYKFQKLDA